MKIVISYHCEICGKSYDSVVGAEKCEGIGHANHLYGQGLMYPALTFRGQMYGIIGVPPQEFPPGHYLKPTLWIARRGSQGDTYGPGRSLNHLYWVRGEHKDERSRTPYFFHAASLPPSMLLAEEFVYTDEFARMAEYLREAGATPWYYTSECKRKNVPK